MSVNPSKKHRLQFILCGASGSGKSTMGHILSEQLGLVRCVTYTTRDPRPGERDGIDYHFRDKLNPSEMFEYAPYGKNQDQYGASWSSLDQSDFIILEPQGVAYYREHFPGDLCVIQLSRENIQVDPERRARDKDAGYDSIHPDYLVTGETIDEMSKNLIEVVTNYLKHKSNARRTQDMHDMNQGPYLIDSIETLSDVITQCANTAIDLTLRNTSAQSDYTTFTLTPDSFCKIIYEDDFKKYFPLIVTELSKREEIMDLEVKGSNLEVSIKKEYCWDYDIYPWDPADGKVSSRELSIAEKARRYEISQILDSKSEHMPSLAYDPEEDYEENPRNLPLTFLSNRYGQPLEGYKWEVPWQDAAHRKFFGVDRWTDPPFGFNTLLGEIEFNEEKFPVVIYARGFSLDDPYLVDPGRRNFEEDIHFMNAVVRMTDAALCHTLEGNCISRCYPAGNENESAELVFILPAAANLTELEQTISKITACMENPRLPLNDLDWCKKQFEAAKTRLDPEFWGDFKQYPKSLYEAHVPDLAGQLCSNVIEFNSFRDNPIEHYKVASHYEADELYISLTEKLSSPVTIETFAREGDPIARTLDNDLHTTRYQLPYGALEDILIQDAKPGEAPRSVEDFMRSYTVEEADDIRAVYESQYEPRKRDLNDMLRNAEYNKGKDTPKKTNDPARQTDAEREKEL